MSRVGRVAALLLALACVGPTVACQTVLLELIDSSGQKGEFAKGMQDLSKLLAEVGVKVETNGGGGANYLRSVFTQTWAKMYERWYLSPPPGHEDDTHWRSLCDALTARGEELRRLTTAKDWVHVHDGLRAAQDALTAFYLPAPSQDHPEAEIALVRTLYRGLARVATGNEPIAADLRETLAHIESRVQGMRDLGMLPPAPETAAAAWVSARAAFLAAVAKDPKQVRVETEALGPVLERLLGP